MIARPLSTPRAYIFICTPKENVLKSAYGIVSKDSKVHFAVNSKGPWTANCMATGEVHNIMATNPQKHSAGWGTEAPNQAGIILSPSFPVPPIDNEISDNSTM